MREVPGEPFEVPRPSGPRAPEALAEEAWSRTDDLAGPYLRIAKTYLVRALPEGFEIVDQHALHERVTFEALVAEVREGRVAVQKRLIPELVEQSGSAQIQRFGTRNLILSQQAVSQTAQTER